MKETKNVPQLRFSGFNDDWEVKKLGEVSDRVTRKNENLESTLPLTISAQYGLVDQITFFNNQVASTTNLRNYFLVKNGEFAYNKSYSAGYPWGAIKRLDRYEKGVLSTLYIVFKPKNINSDYLLSYYDTDKWYKQVSEIAAEGARNHGLLNIAPNDFFQTIFATPMSEIEQQKIGAFLSHVDSLIQANTKKLESLKAVKKSLLQKCFPKAGAKVPKMRFAGFSGEWEEKKLGEIAVFSKGHGYSKNDLIPDGDPIILYGRMYTNYETVISNIDTFVHKLDSSVLSKGGEIIVPASGETAEDIARASVVEKEGIILGGDINIISLPKSVYDSSFVALSISHGESQKELCQNAQGKTIVHLHNDDISKISILFPSLTEQQKIGHFFSKYDSLISAQQKEIDKLKDIKKSLLQKMFV
ncbi:restriction endonuclease subunit S [Treponema succinifaciens]|uniref:restriction endonuclease subunit S n=1 Tax=Treponema succinifaciens TaxID=167 RepID=UPI0023F3BE0C|nr:restriction endonuclease subunit S [Treponema succinifaciens]